MISLLIPIYNFDVRSLVKELVAQCKSAGIEYEVLCYDDGSKPEFKQLNAELSAMPGVTYREMTENLGRAAIRNKLGRDAQHTYLIFMDCDSKVVRKDYIAQYVQYKMITRLICGGRTYKPDPPEDPALRFHWTYGIQREQATAEERNQKPNFSFMSNNFIFPKYLFMDFMFDESLKKYGHEDSQFGTELAMIGIPIYHIDNPLEHLGLEKAEVFVRKTRDGLENLYDIWASGKPIDTRLLQVFRKCRKWGLQYPLALAFPIFRMRLGKELYAESPDLRWFDLYKLSYFAKIYVKGGKWIRDVGDDYNFFDTKF